MREVFTRHHRELFDVDLWQAMQAQNREGEIIDIYPYSEARRLRPARGARQGLAAKLAAGAGRPK